MPTRSSSRCRERITLFRRVCDAVQYAHQNLVVHRDLKPGNILVTAEGHPKLLDFGIAKILSPELDADSAPQTLTAFRVLTPEYASPEQTRGGLVGTASDVYALGVLLYELLTERRPYRLAAQTPEAIARAVCEQDPVRPSTVESVVAGAGRSLRGDLDAIVLKPLEKEPARRYASVEALGDDLGRWLNGTPIRARRVSPPARALKFARRHRLVVTAAAAVLLSLAGGLVAAGWQATVAQSERVRAETERARAQQRFNDVRQLAGFDALRGARRSHEPRWRARSASDSGEAWARLSRRARARGRRRHGAAGRARARVFEAGSDSRRLLPQLEPGGCGRRD